MTSLFENTGGMNDILEILQQMEVNCPIPNSTSNELWKLRRKTKIASHNPSSEIILEYSVAMLTNNGHLTGWFNQCPTSSGIVSSYSDRRSNVDLVHWDQENKVAALYELKWGSNLPHEAIMQILRYGVAYLYCRKHRDKLPVKNRQIMDAHHITLCVLAPHGYYSKYDMLETTFHIAKQSIERLNIKPVVPDLSMSIEVLAFPKNFSVLPFKNGEEARKACDQKKLNSEGEIVQEAFDGLLCLYE